jgi:hypothetical protein
MVACQIPEFKKFCAVLRALLNHHSKHHSKRSRWKFTINNDERLNVDHRHVLVVLGMDVWGRMIAQVHFDDDAEEPANFGHVVGSSLALGKGLPALRR